jgi:hypothetical protein
MRRPQANISPGTSADPDVTVDSRFVADLYLEHLRFSGAGAWAT